MSSKSTFVVGTIIFIIKLLVVLQQQKSHYVDGQITDPSTVQIGDTVCFEGYVMDYFCIDRGTLLDSPSVVTLEGPNKHSIHCLVDVEQCYTSPFEILGDPFVGNTSNSNDQMLYTRAYRVDDNGRSMLIELARSHGKCSTCSGSSESDSTPILTSGFRAEISGIITALSTTGDDDNGVIPVQIQVTTAKRSNNQGSVCGMTRITPAPAPTLNDKSGVNDTGITVLSVIVVLMAVLLAAMSLYYGLTVTSSSKK